jgi:hypothetical protein
MADAELDVYQSVVRFSARSNDLSHRIARLLLDFLQYFSSSRNSSAPCFRLHSFWFHPCLSYIAFNVKIFGIGENRTFFRSPDSVHYVVLTAMRPRQQTSILRFF